MLKRYLSPTLAKIKSLPRKKAALLAAPLIVTAGVVVGITGGGPIAKNTTKSSADYQRELQAAVDTNEGTPQDGRDPASQSQNSLASAASKPDGPGQRTDRPASEVQGDHSHHDPSAKQPGVTSGGCIIGYGNAGQCLQTTSNNQNITCKYVHEKRGFHEGLAVTGKDPLQLDKNRDGTACGHGD